MAGIGGRWLGLDLTRAVRRGRRHGETALVVEGLEEGAGQWAFLEIVHLRQVS